MRWGAALIGLVVLACSEPAPKKRPKNLVTAGELSRDTLNGIISSNQTALMRLTQRPLSSESLSQNLEIPPALADPGAAAFFRYLVQCALPSTSTITVVTSSVTGETVEFRGGVGLAAEWENGPCEQACQEWVSACLFARTNAYELPVIIYLNGPHPVFEDDDEVGPEEQGYVQEGAFYGNFFLDQPRMYACRGDGFDPLHQSVRVCAQYNKGCGFIVPGTCGDVDGDTGLPSDRRACDREGEQDQLYDCWSRATLPGETAHPEPSTKYERVITIHVRKSIFAGGKEAAGYGRAEGPTLCGDAAPPPRPADPPDPGEATAGARCINEDGCDSALLYCSAAAPNYRCTAPCTNNASQTIESASCGGAGATCLGFGNEIGICTAACDAIQAGGAMRRCPRGSMCTKNWLSAPDTTAGCSNWCRDEDDCGGQPCNPRIGACGVALNPELAADGQPCDPTNPEAQCRGLCLVLDPAIPNQGLCTSFINLAVRSRCWDFTSAAMPPLSPDPGGDDLFFCAYRYCADSSVCPPPLQCRAGVINGAMVCSY